MIKTIKNWAVNIAWQLLWAGLGKVLDTFEALVESAEKAGGTPEDKLKYVKENAKKQFPELGEYMLNLLSELAVGKVKGKFSLPRKLRIKL